MTDSQERHSPSSMCCRLVVAMTNMVTAVGARGCSLRITASTLSLQGDAMGMYVMDMVCGGYVCDGLPSTLD